MRFKNPLCQVLCLVITVILHPATTAKCESNSIEAIVTDAVQKMEQNILEKLHAQHMEVIDKQADSIKTLVHILDNFQGRPLEIPKQLTNVTSDLQHHTQEQPFDDGFNKPQNGTSREVKDYLAAHATIVQQMAESIKHLRNLTDHLVDNLSDVEKRLTSMKNASYRGIIDGIWSSCTTVNINKTDTYFIRPAGVVEPFRVLCDFDDNFELGGGWTVFQRRFNGTVDFYQNWTMYKNGFGDVHGEHWLGLEKLHVMTGSGRHEMLVLLEDHDGNSGYALYDSFQIGSEAEKYKLTIGNYSGTVRDALSSHNGTIFTTFDRDDDRIEGHNYAARYDGAWWFKQGFQSHLNGQYFIYGKHFMPGVIWQPWKGYGYSLKSTKMMLRRRSG